MSYITIRKGFIEAQEDGPAETLDPTDPTSLLTHFRSVVEIEDGLTLLDVFDTLAPWGPILSAAGWINFSAWHEAMKEEAHPEPDEGEEIEAIEISPVIHLTTYADLAPNLATSWEARGRYRTPVTDPDGHVHDVCALDFVPAAHLARLPVRIARAAAKTRPFPHRGKLVPPPIGEWHVSPTFFDAIVVGLLDEISAYGSPSETQHQAQELRSMLADLRHGRD